MSSNDPAALWLTVRQALLLIVDGIERFLDIEPRTAELRKELRATRKECVTNDSQ